jgi:hypothetical protein
MNLVPLLGPGSDRPGGSFSGAVSVVILALPLVIAAAALVPALMVCPFWSAAHRRFVLHLLASLRQWDLAAFQRPHDGVAAGEQLPEPAAGCSAAGVCAPRLGCGRARLHRAHRPAAGSYARVSSGQPSR